MFVVYTLYNCKYNICHCIMFALMVKMSSWDFRWKYLLWRLLNVSTSVFTVFDSCRHTYVNSPLSESWTFPTILCLSLCRVNLPNCRTSKVSLFLNYATCYSKVTHFVLVVLPDTDDVLTAVIVVTSLPILATKQVNLSCCALWRH